MYIPPTSVNRYIDGTPNTAMKKFPPNLAADIPKDIQKKMLLWLNHNYIWPQIQERTPFEEIWKKLLIMAKAQLPTESLFERQDDNAPIVQKAKENNRGKARVSDTVFHDAVQRLTDITYFIAFKDGLPVQYNKPEYIETPESTPEYKPLEKRIKAGNAVLRWNSANHKVKRNSQIAYRHHFTYGLCFMRSEFQFEIQDIIRQDNQGNLQPVPEITKIGTTFEPISIRKLWLNWRLPAYDMEMQPCPFYFDEISRFALLQNVYHEINNPFGYVNLDETMAQNYLYNDTESQSVVDALNISFSTMNKSGVSTATPATILEPKHSVEAKWTLYPIMPFDPATGEFEKRADGTLITPQRFVMETFGPNVHSGAQNIIRLQQMYYPKGKLPIYSSCHMPDLDSGLYSPSIGQILWNHFIEITTCTEQYFNNKDWINNPPAWVQVSSPALNQDLNQPGVKIKVNSPNDFGWRTPYDATASTVSMRQMLRDEAQTTSKAVDAILGKAMGSRTSATEASNAFQASMSSITTDIDMLSSDLHGEYAERVWDYTALWFDPDLLKEITGQFGFVITPQDMWMNIGIQTNVGSTFIEKIVRQQNNRYVLESSRGEPGINRAALWKELLEDMGYDADGIIDDGGYQNQIQLATTQSCETFLGRPVLVDPDQDHALAIKVKTAFIKDRNSYWNQTYPEQGQKLIDQIRQHDLFLQMQMQMQLAQQQMQVAQAQLGIHQENPPKEEGGGSSKNPTEAPERAGQVAQQGGGAQ